MLMLSVDHESEAAVYEILISLSIELFCIFAKIGFIDKVVSTLFPDCNDGLITVLFVRWGGCHDR